jgi:hypothetical protein
MTDEQFADLLAKYEEYLSPYGVPMRHTVRGVIPTGDQAARHVLWMCGEVKELLRDGRQEQAQRSLGFIQGVLWSLGHYTLDDLATHNGLS